MSQSIAVLLKNKDPAGPQCFVVLKLGEASAAAQTRVNDVYSLVYYDVGVFLMAVPVL